MSWHPKRRDVLLVLSCLVVFGLFLQLDLAGSSRPSSRRASSFFGFGGLGRKPAFEKGAQRVHYAPDRNTVSQPKLKWGDRGAPFTKIPSHAPGESSSWPRCRLITRGERSSPSSLVLVKELTPDRLDRL